MMIIKARHKITTAGEFFEMPRGEHRYELVKGERITMPPAGFEHGTLADRISLFVFTTILCSRRRKTSATDS